MKKTRGRPASLDLSKEGPRSGHGFRKFTWSAVAQGRPTSQARLVLLYPSIHWSGLCNFANFYLHFFSSGPPLCLRRFSWSVMRSIFQCLLILFWPKFQEGRLRALINVRAMSFTSWPGFGRMADRVVEEDWLSRVLLISAEICFV